MQNKNDTTDRKQICEDEIIKIPSNCTERFLTLPSPHLLPLKETGIRFSGTGTFINGYHIKRFDPHWHTLIYTLEGKGELKTSGQTHTLYPGSLYIAPAHCAHEYWTTDSSWKILWFCLDPRNGFACEPKDPLVMVSSFCPLIASVVQQLTEDPNYTARLKPEIINHCVQLILQIIRHDTESVRVSAQHRQLQRIDAAFLAVHREPSAHWTIALLIEKGHLALGEDRLRQLCVKFYGQTPMERVRHIRLQIAKELLHATDYPLRTIAPMIGYRNEFAFSSAFKRIWGISPSKFRQKRGN